MLNDITDFTILSDNEVLMMQSTGIMFQPKFQIETNIDSDGIWIETKKIYTDENFMGKDAKGRRALVGPPLSEGGSWSFYNLECFVKDEKKPFLKLTDKRASIEESMTMTRYTSSYKANWKRFSWDIKLAGFDAWEVKIESNKKENWVIESKKPWMVKLINTVLSLLPKDIKEFISSNFNAEATDFIAIDYVISCNSKKIAEFKSGKGAPKNTTASLNKDASEKERMVAFSAIALFHFFDARKFISVEDALR
jgi:hypothetical protein